jgi:hypothetical protein
MFNSPLLTYITGVVIVRIFELSAEIVLQESFKNAGVCRRIVVSWGPPIFIWGLIMIMMVVDVSRLSRRSFVKINLARARCMEYRSTA